ncbi:peptidase C39 family protein [Agromyces sp. NPDC056379]|uniref:peptidase C39 family protein n=1 Tax=unclassified Agromyces TaxID=2639701 RepID=UPI0035DBF8D8
MTDTASTAVRGPLLEGALRDAIGADAAAAWERPRHPYDPTVRVLRDGERPIAAALTTRRPSTAATKIVDLWAIDDAAAATLLDELIAASEARGDAALKWELPGHAEAPEPARRRGFIDLRAPHPSAPGTIGTRGLVHWHRAFPHVEPSYYGQTTLFTCGAVTGLLAAEAVGAEGFVADRATDHDLELAFWRQASNYPAIEPIGLAVVMRETLPDSIGVEVFLDSEGPVLIEGYEGFERAFRAELQGDSRRQAGELGVTVSGERLSIDEIGRRVASGRLALLLIDEQPMHGETGPHWVLAHAFQDGVFLIQDPWISSDDGETWVDTHDLPVAASDLDRMVAWGEAGYRGVVFVTRR